MEYPKLAAVEASPGPHPNSSDVKDSDFDFWLGKLVPLEQISQERYNISKKLGPVIDNALSERPTTDRRRPGISGGVNI
jgi:hypothetical protein